MDGLVVALVVASVEASVEASVVASVVEGVLTTRLPTVSAPEVNVNLYEISSANAATPGSLQPFSKVMVSP